jgi:ATP-binding cassette subfamily B protein
MLLFLVALIGETLTVFAQYYFSMLVAQRCLADLRVAIFSHVQRLPTSYFDRNPVGRLVTRMTTDVDVLQEMFAAGVITLASDFVMVIWIVGIMFYLDIELALVSLALIPPMALAINFFRVKARRTYRQIRVRIARINAYLGEAISGMAVIQLFAREQKTYREFEALNADHRDAYHLSNLYEAGLYSMVEAAGSVSVGLLLWYGGGEVLQGIIGIARWSRSTNTFIVFSCRSAISVRNIRLCNRPWRQRKESFTCSTPRSTSPIGKRRKSRNHSVAKWSSIGFGFTTSPESRC